PHAPLPDFKSGLYRDEIPRRVNVAALYRIINKSLDVEIAGGARVGHVGIGDVGGLTALVLLASMPHGIGRVADYCLPNPVAEWPHITAAAQPDHELSSIGPAGGELFRVKPKIIGDVISTLSLKGGVPVASRDIQLVNANRQAAVLSTGPPMASLIDG